MQLARMISIALAISAIRGMESFVKEFHPIVILTLATMMVSVLTDSSTSRMKQKIHGTLGDLMSVSMVDMMMWASTRNITMTSIGR